MFHDTTAVAVAAALLVVAASTCLAQSTTIPTTTLANITYYDYNTLTALANAREARVCIKASSLDACGNEWPKGDFAGDECKPESNCVVRETFYPDGVWRPGHEIRDRQVKWDGAFYNIDYYLRQETWGHDINQRGRMCATPNGGYTSPRLISSRPASQTVCHQKEDKTHSFKIDCGSSPTAPRTKPQLIHYDNSGACSVGPTVNESWGDNNTCYRAPGYTDATSYGSHGPRWVCFPAQYHHYAFILDVNGAGAVSGFVCFAAMSLLAVLHFWM